MSVRAGISVAAILGAAALATPLIARWEGEAPTGYADLGGVATACVGHTGPGVTVGQAYTPAQCVQWLASDAAAHGAAIAACLPEALPTPTRAAFTSFAFNVGAQAFCGSGLARKARGGDLTGACAELSRWIYVKGRVVAGLAARRADERALCERGISG